ncbi:PAAR domain-containing protein [Paraburkholderia tropica]|uniref:PAAR domain-containing protein n=1 Tax=Paraburkholderia tropica TaxID=92647 RepID=UPI002AB0DC05|nr:PAAR domain-containing protein [Paraburkholderia tropica]
MGKRAIICVGDTTSHGGRVLEGTEGASVGGKPIAGVGHMVSCPLCKGVFPIQPTDRRHPHRIHGRDTAVEGMRTACGATLIASQSEATIDDTGDADPYAGDGAAASIASAAAKMTPSQTLCLECLESAAKNALSMVARG